MSYDFIHGKWQENAKESMNINKPLDSMFLFEDKTYENWWMSNQFSIIVFEIEHLLWTCGSHNLKILLKWLIKFGNLIIPKQNKWYKSIPLIFELVLNSGLKSLLPCQNKKL